MNFPVIQKELLVRPQLISGITGFEESIRKCKTFLFCFVTQINRTIVELISHLSCHSNNVSNDRKVKFEITFGGFA